ncbi:MAG: DUF3805 domain-containing protein [Spirochaetota bacterium]
MIYDFRLLLTSKLGRNSVYYKEYESPMNWYKMQYPASWEMEIIENIPAFFDLEGSGALQISAFQNQEGSYELSDEMQRYLQMHRLNFNPEQIAKFQTVDGTEVQTCEFVKEQRFWMVYMLAKEDKLILCTYNADETPDANDARTIGSIARSIQFIS